MLQENVIAAFEKKKYKVSFFKTKEEAAQYMDKEIDGKTVGFGDSETLEAIKIHDLLVSHNKAVYNPIRTTCHEEFACQARQAMQAEVYLTSVNAAAETGEMVNIDGTGNRVSGSLYGHERVFFVFSSKKIEPTLEKAIWRAQNVAAPLNARRKNKKTPCAVRGDKCYDCNAEERLCNALVVYWRKMHRVRADVVIIDEDLGL